MDAPSVPIPSQAEDPGLHLAKQDNEIAETLPAPFQQITETIAVLFQPGHVVEHLALFEDSTASGYYDDMAGLATDADVVETAQPQGFFII